MRRALLGMVIVLAIAGPTWAAQAPQKVPFYLYKARPTPRTYTVQPQPGMSEQALQAAAVSTPLTLIADKRRVAPGDTVVFTGVYLWPVTETTTSPEIWITMTPITPLTILSITGPKSIINVAEVRYDGPTGPVVVTSNPCVLRVSGQTQNYQPVNGIAQIPLGSFLPGEGDTVTVTAKW